MSMKICTTVCDNMYMSSLHLITVDRVIGYPFSTENVV